MEDVSPQLIDSRLVNTRTSGQGRSLGFNIGGDSVRA